MWRDVTRQAFTSLLRRPGRSALTVLGLLIGVASFIAMVAFGDGARKSVVAQFEALGSHAVFVRSKFGSIGATGRAAGTLDDEDAAAVRREVPGVVALAPIMRKMLDVRSETRQTRTQVHASTAEFFVLRNWRAEAGGVILPSDDTRRAPVCVLGATTARTLFGERPDDALGARLRVGDRLHCNVVGVLEAKGAAAAGSDRDDLLVVPVRTYTAAYGFAEGYLNFEAQIAPEVSVASARVATESVLRRTHRLNPGESSDFAISSPDDVIKAADATSNLLGRLLAGVALISLLVGGIGIMNILLVSVGERTQEIGIRSAIGAPPAAILTQFLAEALVLSFMGSGLGAALGSGLSYFVAAKMGWAQVLSWQLIALGTGFGIAVGVVFGILPARRASTLDPIVALRRE
jgi:putative ABC transport system permease protein